MRLAALVILLCSCATAEHEPPTLWESCDNQLKVLQYKCARMVVQCRQSLDECLEDDTD